METPQTPELTVLLAAQGFLLLIAKHTPELVQRNPQVATLVKHCTALSDKLASHRLVNIMDREQVYLITELCERITDVISRIDKDELTDFVAHLQAYVDREIVYVLPEVGNKMVELDRQGIDVNVVPANAWHYTMNELPKNGLIIAETRVGYYDFMLLRDGLFFEKTGKFCLEEMFSEGILDIIRWRIAGDEFKSVNNHE